MTEYTFEQVSEKALEKNALINCEDSWWEFVYEDIKSIFEKFELLDFKIVEFNLDRGRNVKYTCSYISVKELFEVIENKPYLEDYPKLGEDFDFEVIEQTLSKIPLRIKKLIMNNEIPTYIQICEDEYDVEICEDKYANIYDLLYPIVEELHDDLKTEIDALCLKYLQNEWDFKISEKSIEQTLVANGYVFDVNGNII